MKKRLVILASALMIFSQSFAVDAHSGRTDSSGGHKDNKNKSGLGSYHYHCGGNPAHLHNNGCPYQGGGSGESTSTPQSTGSTPKSQAPSGPSKQSIVDKGSNDGYNDGYANNSSKEYSYSGSYEQEYKEAYSEAFYKGREKFESEKVEAEQKGYNDGKENKHDNIYKQETVVKSYESSFVKGNEEYKKAKIEEYKALGIKDCEQNIVDRTFEKDVDPTYIDAYKQSYEQKHIELKNEEFKEKGYNDGIINKHNKNIDSKYITSYEDGYKAGNEERTEILDASFNQGYDGESLNYDAKFEAIKSEIEAKYNEGVKDNKKNTALGFGALGVAGIVGVGVVKKVKNKKRK